MKTTLPVIARMDYTVVIHPVMRVSGPSSPTSSTSSAGWAAAISIVADIVRFARARAFAARAAAGCRIHRRLFARHHRRRPAQNWLFPALPSNDRFVMPDIDVDFDGGRCAKSSSTLISNGDALRSAARWSGRCLHAKAVVRDLEARPLGMPLRPSTRSPAICNRARPQMLDLVAEYAGFGAYAPNHPHRLLRELMADIDGVPRRPPACTRAEWLSPPGPSPRSSGLSRPPWRSRSFSGQGVDGDAGFIEDRPALVVGHSG